MIGEREMTTHFAAYQKKTKDDATDEQPPPNVKGDCHAVLCLWTVVENLVRPLLGGQHGDSRKYIQDVDKEVLEHDNIEPHVPGVKESERGELASCKYADVECWRYLLGSHTT